MKKILFCLILILSNVSYSQKMLYGNLSAHIDSVLRTTPDDTASFTDKSSDSIKMNFISSIIEQILKSDFRDAKEKTDSIGYHIIRLVDTTALVRKSYFLLEKKNQSDRYYGIYVFNPNPQSPRIIFQHSSKNNDDNLPGKSIYIFTKYQARAIFFPPRYSDFTKFDKNLCEIIQSLSELEKRDAFLIQLDYFTKIKENSDLIIGTSHPNNISNQFLSKLYSNLSFYNPDFKIQIENNQDKFYKYNNLNLNKKILFTDGSIYYPLIQFIDIFFINKNFTNNKNLDDIVELIIKNISEYKDNVVFPVDSSRTKIQFGIRTDLTMFYKGYFQFNGHYNNEFNTYFNTYYVLLLPVSIYLYSRIELADNINLEIRPGFLLAGDDFSVLELGILFYWYFLNKEIYILGGINFRSNKEYAFLSLNEGGGNQSTTIHYDTKILKSVGIGIGSQLLKKISVDFSIFKSLKEKYADLIYSDFAAGPNKELVGNHPEYLYFYMKFGINFTF